MQEYKISYDISSSSYLVYPAHRKKLWTGFGEGRTATTHTHKGERGQMSPPARARYGDIATRER